MHFLDLVKEGALTQEQPHDSYYPEDDVDRTRDRYQSSAYEVPEYYSARQDKPGDKNISPFLRSQAWEESPDVQVHTRDDAANDIATSRLHTDGRHPLTTTNNRESFPNSFISASSPPKTIARADLRASAEKILLSYLVPGAEREVVLPEHIVKPIHNAIDKHGRDDPEVFGAAREYIFLAMERDAFPGFLESKALGNIVPSSSLIRLILGLFALWAGLWAGFVLIFLDYPRTTRSYLAIPFTIGTYFLVGWAYGLDPIMALIGFSESTLFSFRRIEEPYGNVADCHDFAKMWV